MTRPTEEAQGAKAKKPIQNFTGQMVLQQMYQNVRPTRENLDVTED